MNHFCQCWGRGSNGRLGIGDTSETHLGDNPGEMGLNLPSLIFSNGFIPVQLSSGLGTSCAVSTDHTCSCWGSGGYGQMGQGNSLDVYVPTTVSLGSGFDVELVNVGHRSACAVSMIGDLKVCNFGNAMCDFECASARFCQCWGRNNHGQLGYVHDDGSVGDEAHEIGDALQTVDLGADFIVIAVHSGEFQRCAFSADGRVKVFYMCIVWSDPI